MLRLPGVWPFAFVVPAKTDLLSAYSDSCESLFLLRVSVRIHLGLKSGRAARSAADILLDKAYTAVEVGSRVLGNTCVLETASALLGRYKAIVSQGVLG